MMTLQILTSELLGDAQQQCLQSLVDFARVFRRVTNCAKLDRLNRFLSQPISDAYCYLASKIGSVSLTREFRYKLVVAVRRDLDMGKGKIAVQVGHAVITAAEETKRAHPDWWQRWFDEGQCKVAVKVTGESDLSKLNEAAKELGLPSAIIHDSGLTQILPGTATCVGIGPAPVELVDKITGNLPLL